MKRILCLLVAALFAGGGAASADTFRFAYTKGEKYRIVSQIRESVYVNGSYSHDSDILDKIAVTVTDTKGDAGLHDVTYEDSERVVGSDAPYDWSEEYTSTFWRDARGAYTIDPSLFMPMVRDVPLFPDGEIKQGDTWLARGSEVDDFRANFGIPQPFQFPIDVEYTYTGRETRDGVDCAVFSINYEIFHPVTAAATGKMYPTRVPAIRIRSSGGTSRGDDPFMMKRASISSTPSIRATRLNTRAIRKGLSYRPPRWTRCRWPETSRNR